MTTFTYGHAKRSVVPRVCASAQRPPTTEAVDRDAAVDAKNATPTQPVLVAAPFISPRTQERLKAKGFGYADLKHCEASRPYSKNISDGRALSDRIAVTAEE